MSAVGSCARVGVDDVGQVRDGFSQAGVGVDGVLPDLVGVGGEVDLGVGVAVEDAGLLVIQVENRPVVAVVLEERLVGADDLGVLLEALADARAQADDPLDAVGREGRSSRGSSSAFWPMRSTRPARWISRMIAQGRS